MWISNTATTMLMVTTAIAYSANIGGMGRPVGTVPNLVFLENIRLIDPALVPSFMEWMMIGVPVVIIGIMIVVTLLGRRIKGMPWSKQAMDGVATELKGLGTMRRDEKFVAWVLGLTALA